MIDKRVMGHLALAYVFSLLIVLLIVIASLAGLLYPSVIYPTDELRQSFVANDLVKLLVATPALLGSMWLARRGKLIGQLFWPGALFYVLYDYVAYLYAAPLNIWFLFYLVLVTSSAYTLIGLVAAIDAQAVRQRLAGGMPTKLAGGVLIGMGGAFALLAIGTIGSALFNQTPIARTELAVLVADSVISPAWVIGGVLLWRRKALGYVAGPGLLFQASALFVGVILVVLLQSLLTAAPFNLGDLIVLAAMALICLIPFGLVVRGILSAGE